MNMHITKMLFPQNWRLKRRNKKNRELQEGGIDNVWAFILYIEEHPKNIFSRMSSHIMQVCFVLFQYPKGEWTYFLGGKSHISTHIQEEINKIK